tara:strand:- start:2678 stop:2914 length:237 start_codon:yes stop_codon:yes gene_type:complete
MFGYRVRWNVQGHNNTHKTFLGAFSTIGYLLLLCVVFYFLCQDSFKAILTDSGIDIDPKVNAAAELKKKTTTLLRNLE